MQITSHTRSIPEHTHSDTERSENKYLLNFVTQIFVTCLASDSKMTKQGNFYSFPFILVQNVKKKKHGYR